MQNCIFMLINLKNPLKISQLIEHFEHQDFSVIIIGKFLVIASQIHGSTYLGQ